MQYSERVMAHFEHLDHAGCLQSGDDIHVAEVGSEAQGDVVRLFIQIENKKISHASFQCYGSVVTLAICEYLCRSLSHLSIEAASSFTPQNILSALELPETRVHSAVLVLSCLKKLLSSI